MTKLKIARLAAGLILLGLGLGACPALDSIVVKTDPLTAEEHARLGAIYERDGDLDRAAQEYTAALKKDPNNLVALVGMGNVLLHQGKPELAAVYYERALLEDPENIVILNNLATAWLQAGRPGKALELANRAVELSNAQDPRVLDTRAQARLALGDEAGARADLDAAGKLCQQQKDPTLAEPCAAIQARRQNLDSK